jgi:hypothetical protein
MEDLFGRTDFLKNDIRAAALECNSSVPSPLV